MPASVCAASPTYVASLPAAAKLLARARAAGATVVYGKASAADQVLPQVA